MSSTTKRSNFYEILNASNTATADELKSNYKQLILQCHPDKLQQQLENNTHTLVTKNSDAAANNSEFVAITEAWNCLKDPVKRKHYDAEQLLNKFQTHNNIYAHIKLSEMKKQLNMGEYLQDNDEEQTVVVEPKIKESEEENETKYLYTYDCRCGGQYIVDESAEQYCGSGNRDHHHHHHHETQIKSNDNNGVDDDADSTQNSPNKVKNNGGGGGVAGGSTAAAAGSEGVVFVQHNHHDDDDEEEVDDESGELIVECSECSLVIILNG